ncbi:hypothetical protein L7F22_045810 [Adiantum nelumboides]|nr:hypothetical protein [Adiantum nelumboides]
MAASAPVLGTAQDAPRPIPWTYELTPEDEMEMQTAIEHLSGRTLVRRLVGTTTSRPTVREWIESALGSSTARILELSMMTAGLFLLQLSDSVSTNALLARSPISSGSRLLVFQRWTPQFDQDEFDRQQQIPRFPVTLSFPSLPIFMRRCIPRMAARWGIVIPGSLMSKIGTPRIQVYAPGDTQFPDLVHIRDCAGQIRAQRMITEPGESEGSAGSTDTGKRSLEEGEGELEAKKPRVVIKQLEPPKQLEAMDKGKAITLDGSPEKPPAPQPNEDSSSDTDNDLYAIATRKPYRDPLQLAVCLGQLYGCIVYFVTAQLDGIEYAAGPFYYWFYYIFMNYIWVVIPSIISWRSWRRIVHQFENKRAKSR